MGVGSCDTYPLPTQEDLEVKRIQRLISTVLSGGGVAVPTYAEILRDTYGASEVYPLTDIPSGTTIHAFVSGGHDGILTGWDLQNTAGPVAGGSAPYSGGTGDVGNVLAISTDFNGAVGSAFIFGKVSDVADWSDGATRELFNYKVNNNNWIRMYKHSTLGLDVYVAIGGVAKIIRTSTTTTDWFCLGVSWKDSANGNEVKAFFNGAQSGATQTGFGAWAGTIVTGVIGSSSASPAANVWKGWLAYQAFKFGSIWTPTNFSDIYAARLTGGPDVNP